MRRSVLRRNAGMISAEAARPALDGPAAAVQQPRHLN